MRSGRATVGEPRKNDDLERTRDQKRRSNSSANAAPEPIGDRTRTEAPGLVTNRLKANSSARASIRMRPPKGWKLPFEDPRSAGLFPSFGATACTRIPECCSVGLAPLWGAFGGSLWLLQSENLVVRIV